MGFEDETVTKRRMGSQLEVKMYDYLYRWVRPLASDLSYYYEKNFFPCLEEVQKIANLYMDELPEYFLDIIFERTVNKSTFKTIGYTLSIDEEMVKKVYFEFLDTLALLSAKYVANEYRVSWYEPKFKHKPDVIWGYFISGDSIYNVKEINCGLTYGHWGPPKNEKHTLSAVYLTERDDKRATNILREKNNKHFNSLWNQMKKVEK